MIAERSTAVIITAKDAEATVAKAVASALAQPEAAEVVLVDDGSRDRTSAVAETVDDGSGRLQILRLARNRGPSHGRNLAIAVSRAPYLCILDADDFMTPGRLGRLIRAGGEGWDVLADDLLFYESPDAAEPFDRLLEPGFATPRDLTLSEFGFWNLPRRRRPRRELGFLKPLIRRAFLESHRIGYDERLRLGEDLVFYARCLMAGGSFRVVEACGYGAVQSPDSLSGRHDTADVERLHRSLCELAQAAAAQGVALGDFARCIQWTRDNLALRRALDWKRDAGLKGFMAAVGASPESLGFIVSRIAQDKLGAALARR